MARSLVLGTFAALGATACLITNAPPDGDWSSMQTPCVPAGALPRGLVSGLGLQHYAIGGDTILFGADDMLQQIRVAGGEPVTVARAYREGPIGVFANDLVYIVRDEERGGEQVVLDRGLDAEVRWEMLGRSASSILKLLVIPAGVYWARDPARIDWRWSPDTGTGYFGLVAAGAIPTDGTDLLFRQIDGLWTMPVAGGAQHRVVEGTTERPLAIDAGAIYFAHTPVAAELPQLIVARSRTTGLDRTLVTMTASKQDGRVALGGGYLYYVDTIARSQLRRVPIAGGPVEVFFTGTPGYAVWDPTTDDCNVYWSTLGPTNTIYAQSH